MDKSLHIEGLSGTSASFPASCHLIRGGTIHGSVCGRGAGFRLNGLTDLPPSSRNSRPTCLFSRVYEDIVLEPQIWKLTIESLVLEELVPGLMLVGCPGRIALSNGSKESDMRGSGPHRGLLSCRGGHNFGA